MKYVEKYSTISEINTALGNNELGFPFTGLITSYSPTKPLYINKSVSQVVTNLSDLNNTTYTSSKGIYGLSDNAVADIVYTSGYTNYIFTSIDTCKSVADSLSYPANCYFMSSNTYRILTSKLSTYLIDNISNVVVGNYYVNIGNNSNGFITSANLSTVQSGGGTVIGIAATTYSQISGHEGVRVMALNYARNTTPDAGASSGSGIYWGGSGVDISTLTNYTDDYEGKSNTEKILVLATGESWKTITSITNSRSSGYYPAAECTWRYHTVGTSQGDWYLAAQREWLAMYSNKTIIDSARTTLGLSVLSNSNYWTSNEVDSNYSWYVFWGAGSSGSTSKDTSNYVLPILLVTNI